jgi:hypothetical protein
MPTSLIDRSLRGESWYVHHASSLILQTWTIAKAKSRYSTTLASSYAWTTDELWLLPWSTWTATATLEIVAGSDVSLSKTRNVAGRISTGEGAALQTLQQVQLSRQLRHNGGRIGPYVSARGAVMSASVVKRCGRSKSWYLHFKPPIVFSAIEQATTNRERRKPAKETAYEIAAAIQSTSPVRAEIRIRRNTQLRHNLDASSPEKRHPAVNLSGRIDIGFIKRRFCGKSW